MSVDFYRSLGLELAGAKSDRTALAILDYYPKSQRLILVDVNSSLHETDEENGDEVLIAALNKAAECKKGRLTGISISAPMSLPPFFLGAQGVGESKWLKRIWTHLKTPKPKPFLNYLQRPAEVYLKYLSPENFEIPEALGSNMAPLTARVQFLEKNLPQTAIETYPKGVVRRICSNLGLAKNLARYYTDFDKGLPYREDFILQMLHNLPQIFMYDRDMEKITFQLNHFHAFFAAFNQHLYYAKQTEKPPQDFPKKAAWIHIPAQEINWDKVFF